MKLDILFYCECCMSSDEVELTGNESGFVPVTWQVAVSSIIMWQLNVQGSQSCSITEGVNRLYWCPMAYFRPFPLTVAAVWRHLKVAWSVRWLGCRLVYGCFMVVPGYHRPLARLRPQVDQAPNADHLPRGQQPCTAYRLVNEAARPAKCQSQYTLSTATIAPRC